jgi:AsnC-type helix-turn-helix domain
LILDEIDLKILRRVLKDARMSYRKIADEIDVSPPIFAKTDGCLYILPVMSVPSFILEVIPARTEMVVQPSSIGSSGFPTPGI